MSSGRFVLPARQPLHVRLKELFSSLAEVIDEYGPDEIVIEKMFFAKGIKAALSMGHTRGVVILPRPFRAGKYMSIPLLKSRRRLSAMERLIKFRCRRW